MGADTGQRRESPERFGPGELPARVRAGDFILTHRRHLVANLISRAQRRRFRGPDRPYAHWSHCAILVDDDGTLVEAETRGVQVSPLHKYREAEFHLVRIEVDGPQRADAAKWAREQVGARFGFLVLFSLGYGSRPAGVCDWFASTIRSARGWSPTPFSWKVSSPAPTPPSCCPPTLPRHSRSVPDLVKGSTRGRHLS